MTSSPEQMVKQKPATATILTEVVQSGVGEGFPRVEGVCPACGYRSLFVGLGGYVTCSVLSCPDPTAVSDLLAPKENPHAA